MAAQEKTNPYDPAQLETPFVADLAERSRRRFRSFHMPGHKQTPPGDGLLTELCGAGLFQADLSEMGGLDYLHSPESSLKSAQSLAAHAFGAGATFFLINGTTAGNQAAILASVPPGKKLLLPRASHRSVYASLLLADAEPVYVPPIVQTGNALPLATDLDAVAHLLTTTPDIAAIHITSPSYYGFCSDLTGIAKLAKAHGVTLIVDEAHGAHFTFHPAFPPSAMEAGADIAVQSTHKTIGSLTQSSMLHVRDGFPHHRQLQQALAMLQSSSPSALLLASLDATRATLATHGHELLDRTLELTAHTRSAIDTIPGLTCIPAEIDPATGRYRSDPTKILIRVRDLGITGFTAAAWLIEKRGIEVELKDLDHILCTITIADTESSVTELITALRTLSEQPREVAAINTTSLYPLTEQSRNLNDPTINTTVLHALPEQPHNLDDSAIDPAALSARYEQPRNADDSTIDPAAQPVWPATPPAAISLRRAFHAESNPMPFADAIGQISAEFVIPYPPGIPILLPGEIITPETASYARSHLARGGRIVGPEDPHLHSLRVITET